MIHTLRGLMKRGFHCIYENADDLSCKLYRMEDCKETLREICDLASEADDLRAQAVYDCCHFDLLLDAGKS